MAHSNPKEWLQQVVSLVQARQWDQAQQAFESAYMKLNDYQKKITPEELGFQPGLSSAHVLYEYAKACAEVGEPERALPKLRDLAHLLAGFRNSDDYYLAARGMVTLDSFCEVVEKVYPATSADPTWRALFKELQSKLDDDGRSRIYELRQSLS